MTKQTHNARLKAKTAFPKGSIAKHKRTGKLYRVLGLEWRSDRLILDPLDGGERDFVWWKYLEDVHPLLALAACAEAA